MAENAKQTGGSMAKPQTGQNVADTATPTEPAAPATGAASNAGGTDDVQSKIDEALNAERKKWDAELETRLSEAISESERLAKLNADDERNPSGKRSRKNLRKNARNMSVKSLNLKRVNHLWTKDFRLNSLHFWRRTTPRTQRRI